MEKIYGDVAVTAECQILRTNGYYFERLDEDEIFDVLHKIASYECGPRLIAIWVKKKSHKMERG